MYFSGPSASKRIKVSPVIKPTSIESRGTGRGLCRLSLKDVKPNTLNLDLIELSSLQQVSTVSTSCRRLALIGV